MIGFFPSIYEDELVYSLLARYYVRTGYMAYAYVAEDLFENKGDSPSIEFVNPYKAEIRDRLTKDVSMWRVVEKHTMFSSYARFLPVMRKRKAFESLMACTGNYDNLLALPRVKTGAERHLLYCPVCAKEDREENGEAYWHRKHQIRGIVVCSQHRCFLKESDILISGKTSPMFYAAEQVIPYNDSAKYCQNEVILSLAEYMGAVFDESVDMQSEIGIGAFLHSQMEGTRYLSPRGQQRKITAFCKDFSEFYKELPGNDFGSVEQMQKIFNGYRYGFQEVCMIAYFLKVPVKDLARMRLPDKSQMEQFDEAVHELHGKGMKYPAIAKELNASVNVVKPIGERVYGTKHHRKDNPQKGGVKARDWAKMDAELLPKVQVAIRELKQSGEERPRKVSVFGIEKMLNLKQGQIKNLPKCKSLIEKNMISQTEYWAQEIVWAYNVLMGAGVLISWTRIRRMINITKADAISCLPELEKIIDAETYSIIERLL